MPTLIATKAVRHGGAFHDAGGRFEATQQHARVLIAIGKAKLAPSEAPPALPAPPVLAPAPAPVQSPAPAPASQEPPAVESKTKGVYNRRDLKAKE